jgi:hypothetical protein
MGAVIADEQVIKWIDSHNNLARRGIDISTIKIDPNFSVFQADQCECGF